MPLRLVTPTFATLITVGGGGHTIQEDGSSLAQEPILNFIGANITCAPGSGKTNCTITGATLALDNLASVAINTTLLPATAGSADLGSTSKPFGTGYFGSTQRTTISHNGTNGVMTVSTGRLVPPNLLLGSGSTNICSEDAYCFMWPSTAAQHVLIYVTGQTPDTLVLAAGTVSRTLVFVERGDELFDFAVPQQTHPTIVFASATQGTQTRGGLRHNDTQVELTDLAATASSARPVRLMGGSAVASASTITPTGNSPHVTGTTNIDTVTAMGAGTFLTLIFDGVLTVNDGSNLKLNGNFTTSADDTLTLVSDGTNWYEIQRSTN